MTGWEGAAPLAEETANPRRNVAWATIGSILLIGTFLTVVTYGVFIGWGTDLVLDPDNGLTGGAIHGGVGRRRRDHRHGPLPGDRRQSRGERVGAPGHGRGTRCAPGRVVTHGG